MKLPPKFSGAEADTALVADARRMVKAFGGPRVVSDALVGWVADWVSRGGRTLNKPTHFDSRDGTF
jgi:hypothetical protein